MKVRTHSQNTKKLWEIIKSKIGKNSSQGNTINHISVNNQTIDKKSDIANTMNPYFCEIGPKLSTKLSKSNIDNCKLTPPNRNPESIFFRLTLRRNIQTYKCHGK